MNPLPRLFQPFLDQRDRWFLWLPVFMVFGIGLYFILPTEPPSLFLAATPVWALIGLALRRFYALRPLLIGLLTLALGFNAAQLETRLTATTMLEEPLQPTSVTGLLYEAEALPSGSRLTIKKPWIKGLDNPKLLRFVRVKVRTPFTELPAPGARVNVWGPLWPPSDSVAPNDYDFRRNAFFKQLGASGLSYGELREREAKYPPRFFWDGFNLMFERARRALSLMVLDRLPPEQAPMTAALLSGSQAGIDRAVMDAMRASGLSHLLSISGIHVSMIALLIYLPLRFLLALSPFLALRLPIKKIAAVSAMIGTTFYTLLVGTDAPTVRSAIMTGLVMFAIVVDRKAMSLRLVALAALLIMLMTPSAAIGPSFQMSFAAVMAMVAAYEKRIDAALREGVSFDLPSWLRGTGRHCKDIVVTSLLATAATTPFTLFHFQVFSIYGVVANMIAIPLTSLWIMPCLLLTYIMAPFDASGWFIDGAGLGVQAIIGLAEKVAAWPFSQLYLPPMPVWAFLLFVSGGFWLCLWRDRVRWLGVLPLFLACLYPLTVTLPSVFVAPEGDVWAVRLADDRLATFGKRDENFTIHQWRQRTLNPEVISFTKRKLPDLGQELSCDETACVFQKNLFKATFILKDAPQEKIAPLCAKETGALVAPHIALSGCKASILIDQAALKERGAHVITLIDQRPVVETAREARGLRPWSVGWRKEEGPQISISEEDPQASPAP